VASPPFAQIWLNLKLYSIYPGILGIWRDGFKVKLHVYDLSQGLARQLSATFLGKAIEAVWHTGLVVYGKEYYFSGGIQHDPAGKTPYGNPVRIVDLGVTHVPEEVFEEYLQEISPRYTGATYSLLSHNCNNFSNEVAQFLVDTTIPDYILRLPNEVMSSPMGALILPMIQQLETTLKSGTVPQAPQFAPAAAVAAMPAAPSAVTSSPTTTDASVQATGKDNSLVAGDPLGEARNIVQEEIAREFTAIMATGTLRASEAAALAARRVMERHGLVNAPMQRG
ncbi:unnamed protein product, partial [Musa acuminata subsp. malaccensis]